MRLPVLPRSGLSGRSRSGSPGGWRTSTESKQYSATGLAWWDQLRGAGEGHEFGHAVDHALERLRHRIQGDAGASFESLPDGFAGPFVVGDVGDAQQAGVDGDLGFDHVVVDDLSLGDRDPSRAAQREMRPSVRSSRNATPASGSLNRHSAEGRPSRSETIGTTRSGPVWTPGRDRPGGAAGVPLSQPCRIGGFGAGARVVEVYGHPPRGLGHPLVEAVLTEGVLFRGVVAGLQCFFAQGGEGEESPRAGLEWYPVASSQVAAPVAVEDHTCGTGRPPSRPGVRPACRMPGFWARRRRFARPPARPPALAVTISRIRSGLTSLSTADTSSTITPDR